MSYKCYAVYVFMLGAKNPQNHERLLYQLKTRVDENKTVEIKNIVAYLLPKVCDRHYVVGLWRLLLK